MALAASVAAAAAAMPAARKRSAAADGDGSSKAAMVAAARRGAVIGPPRAERRCQVVLASTGGWAEVAAVEKIFRRCSIESLRVPSGVNEQPIGHDEALRGAANRLEAARVARPGADYYIAIESCLLEVVVPPTVHLGLPTSSARTSAATAASTDTTAAGEAASSPLAVEDDGTRHYDTGWVLIERAGAVPIRAAAPSCAVEIPPDDVSTARERGFAKQTAGAVSAERAGLLDGKDPHNWLTAGRRSREALLGEAIAVALGQLERVGRTMPPPATQESQQSASTSASENTTTGRTRWFGGTG